MESDLEIGQSEYTAKYWEYDARIARRWNVDPLANTTPQYSPFSCLNNSPLSVVDPSGATGEPTVDKKNHTITFHATFFLYGNISSRKMARMTRIANKQLKMLNESSFKVRYNGEYYAAKFDLKATNVSEGEAAEMAGKNTSLANNFIRVEDIPATSLTTGFNGVRGSNSGFWTTPDVMGAKSNPTTIVHEVLHSFGLDHPKKNVYTSGPFVRVEYYDKLRMITPRYSNMMIRIRDFYVKDPYNPTSSSFKFVQMKPSDRRLTSEDIQEVVNYMNAQQADNKIYTRYPITH